MSHPPPSGFDTKPALARLLLVALAAALGLGAWQLWQVRRSVVTRPQMTQTPTACQLLARHNALAVMGGQGRLHRLPQPVAVWASPALEPLARRVTALVGQQTGVRFQWQGGQPPRGARGIVFEQGVARNADGSPGCGQAVDFHRLGQTRVLLPARPASTCPARELVLLHETVHALGFVGHVATPGDATILHQQDRLWPSMAQWSNAGVDKPLKKALRLLYVQPLGAGVEAACGASEKKG